MADSNLISLADLGAALAALSALSTASFGLLDATKAWGGVSNIGRDHIRDALMPYKAALDEALSKDRWWPIVLDHWVAGVPKAEQKAKTQAMIKLGLSPASAPAVARAALVDPKALTAAVVKLRTGAKLTGADLNILGRMNAVIDIQLDAAFEAADQEYRNKCRVLAGLLALALTIGGWLLWSAGSTTKPPSLWIAVAVGLLAVPLAPVAKDLTGALSAAMRALKAANRL